MTTDVELPPCPFCGVKLHEHEHSFVHPHPSPAHGFCLIAGLSFRRDQLDFWSRRTTAAKDAELVELRSTIEALRARAERAEAEARDYGDQRDEAIGRAERLAEALREIAEPLDCGCKPCRGDCRQGAWEWMQEVAANALLRDMLGTIRNERYPEVEENKQVTSKHCTCSTDPSITCIVHPRGRSRC